MDPATDHVLCALSDLLPGWTQRCPGFAPMGRSPDRAVQVRTVIPAIRSARADELPAILKLWMDAGVERGHTDDIESLTRLIAHDPDALLVAAEEEQIVGSVIAAWDGWRGTVYRLAVAPAHRHRGIGRKLVSTAVKRLRAVGAVRLQAIVIETDARATAFWRASDWTEQVERVRFTLG